MLNSTTDHVINNIKQVAEKYQEILLLLLQGKGSFMPTSLWDNDKNRILLTSTLEQFLANPEKFFGVNFEYIGKFQELMKTSIDKFMGHHVNSMYTPKQKDRRFKDKAWEENIFFDFVKQFYLMSSEWLQKSVDQCDLEPSLKKYLEFSIHQFIDAVSPSNFILYNPQVLRESLENGFDNVVNGLDKFLNDIKNSQEIFNIKMTESSGFKLGRNIATTPGKVVFENELMQLICYKPKKSTFSIPLLIVPPCINKYYVLDLSPNNSLVKFLVDNNFQVFMISWVNPHRELADKDFEDYVLDGVLESFKYINNLGYKKINALGYCIGGTLLATAAAYIKKRKLNFLNSLSFLNSLLDFENPGEIEVFINEPFISSIEHEVNSKGYFDGRYLANSFSLLRANDLIWSFFINNYLLDKTPPLFDILYWNSDPTNLPAKMYIYYLRNMYLNNLLKSKNALKMRDVPIDLGLIDYPSFFLAAIEDHISPWKTVYKGSKLLNGEKVFCLTTSGHVAGVVNPPSNMKYSYKIGHNVQESPDEWISKLDDCKGSWWVSWKDWLKGNSKKLQKSIDYNKLDYIEEAPGKYVKASIN